MRIRGLGMKLISRVIFVKCHVQRSQPPSPAVVSTRMGDAPFRFGTTLLCTLSVHQSSGGKSVAMIRNRWWLNRRCSHLAPVRLFNNAFAWGGIAKRQSDRPSRKGKVQLGGSRNVRFRHLPTWLSSCAPKKFYIKLPALQHVAGRFPSVWWGFLPAVRHRFSAHCSYPALETFPDRREWRSFLLCGWRRQKMGAINLIEY